MAENSNPIFVESHITPEVPIPRYDPDSQLGVGDLDTLYPEWRDEHPGVDSELLLFDFVRTQEDRNMAQLAGLPDRFMKGEDEGLEKAVKQIPREVGSRFQAHGIAGKSGSSSGELDVLLTEGIKPDRTFYTMELSYIDNMTVAHMLGARMPMPDGGLITVFGKDDRHGGEGIKYVIVGAKNVKCLDVMQARYPDVTFVPWHDAPQFFTDMVNAEEGSHYRLNTIDYPDSFDPIIESGELSRSSPSDQVGKAAVSPVVDVDPDEPW